MSIQISESVKNLNERNYGVDLLRVVSMLMIVLLHVLGRGGILKSLNGISFNFITGWLLEISAYCAVNCYGIISGYVSYGHKHKYSNIIYLTFQVVCYVLVFTEDGGTVLLSSGKTVGRFYCLLIEDGGTVLLSSY